MQLLVAEAWRNERLINHFRTGILSVAVVLGGTLTTIMLGRPHPAILLMSGWLVFVTIFNATWFKKNFHPAVPWVLCATEILVFGLGFLLSRPIILASRPDLADRQLAMLPAILMFVVSINMMRFSWRLSIFCAAFALTVLLYVHLSLGTIDGLLVPMLMLLIAIGLLLAYTTRRFERLLQRQAIDLRRIQRERIGSLRSLVAGVCHELNTPLGALRSNAQTSLRSIELLSDPKKADRALAALGKVASATEQATDRIEKTIRSLKSFAGLDEAEVRMAEVQPMLDDALALLSAELESIEIETKHADLPAIACRPGELNQVFMHVLRNAAQAGAKRISIATKQSEPGIEVAIADDGRGMSKEMLARIFDPTFSSEGGRVKMGFGLSASLGILEDHGGRIDIESEEGRGTTVRIVIGPNLRAGP